MGINLEKTMKITKYILILSLLFIASVSISKNKTDVNNYVSAQINIAVDKGKCIFNIDSADSSLAIDPDYECKKGALLRLKGTDVKKGFTVLFQSRKNLKSTTQDFTFPDDFIAKEGGELLCMLSADCPSKKTTMYCDGNPRSPNCYDVCC